MEKELQGKVALVTGASRGIGRAICMRLAKEGMQVAFTYSRDEEGAKETIACIEEYGVKALALKSNVAIEADCKQVVKAVLESFGQLDVLVNNAGVTRDKLLMRMEEKDFDDVVDVNLKGTFLMTKEVVPAMLKKREGRIINISSVSGVLGNAGQTNYSASKAGVIGFTKASARELAGKHIRVNAIAPGMIQTDMIAAMTEKATEQLSAAIPMKEIGLPEDIAGVVAFLCGKDSRYITGQVLCVDGGMAI